MEDVKKAGIEEEFNSVVDKLQSGELVGDIMDIVNCDVELKCGSCGSEEINWILDQASDEVIFNCKVCKNRGWMKKEEYDEAVKNNPDCIIQR